MDTKICTGPCGRDLPLTAFHRNGPVGFQNLRFRPQIPRSRDAN